MSTEKDFYNILRSKFEEKEHPFNQADWTRMRAMIDLSRQGRKRNVWFIAAVTLLLCGGGALAGYGIFGSNNQGGTSNSVSATSSQHDSKLAAIDNQATAVNQVTSASSSASVPNHSDVSSSQSSPVNHSQSFSARNNTTALALSTKNSARQIGRVSKAHHSNSGAHVIIASNNQAGPISASQIAQENYKVGILGGSEYITPRIASLKEIDQVPDISVALQNASVSNTVRVLDTAITGNTLPPRFSDEPRIFRGEKDVLSIEAGVEWTAGWQYGVVTQGHGLNPMVGVGYAHYLGHKLFLKTGLQFTAYENMSSVTYNYQHSVSTSPSNYTLYDSVITTKSLYFLSVPVQLEYYVGHKISIGLGGSVLYLLGSSTAASTYQEYDNLPGVEQNVQQYSKGIEQKGYTSFNASAHALVKYTFSPRFSAYGIIYDGLINMKDNNYFGNSLFERDKGGRILLSYSF